MKRHLQFIALALVTSVTAAVAHSSSTQTGIFWVHNGSYMAEHKDGDNLILKYDPPRKGLGRLGIRTGTTLFHGRFLSGRRLAGTAYTFKRGCQPASYNVSGRVIGNTTTPDKYKIILKGATPVRDGCVVVGYKNSGNSSRLVFDWAGTGD